MSEPSMNAQVARKTQLILDLCDGEENVYKHRDAIEKSLTRLCEEAARRALVYSWAFKEYTEDGLEHSVKAVMGGGE